MISGEYQLRRLEQMLRVEFYSYKDEDDEPTNPSGNQPSNGGGSGSGNQGGNTGGGSKEPIGD